MGADASTAPLGSSKYKKQIPIFHQILIVIHGSRKSGKSSLLRRMNGLNILPQYTPTKCLQASEIIWHPICMHNESIKIIVWDVVDKAIDQTPQSQRTKQLPDATNVDTFSRADGIIVIYDPRDEDSIKYARSILDQAPQSKPTLIVMNFSDSFETPPSVPTLMEPYTNSFFHLTASMKTNQGLAELANWLDLPMNVSLSKIYELHLKQSEEKLNNLLKEFNLTGLDENQEQPSQTKGKGSSKDFWSNDNDDRKVDTYGSNEVSADFFMDDDESDLKAKQNLEKIKKTLNLTGLEEEDTDEEFKMKMAKKKSKILSKNTPNNQTNKMTKPIQQTQNQIENEYSDNEYNNEENESNKQQQQVSIPQISFDIPVVAENDNSFFEDDDENDDRNNKDLENDDVDNKLEELKKKLKLEIPKEEEDEEEKPKVKKSKILPKAKPPQIIIKPAQPKVQQQEKPEIKSTSSVKKENENTKDINSESTTNKNKIPIVSNEENNFFSDENKSEIQKESINTSNTTENQKIENITMPSFDDETIQNENKNENIVNEENKSKDEKSFAPSNEKETIINIPTVSDFALPSFGNDDFFGDDEENDKEDQLTNMKMAHEEEEDKPNKAEKKSKILPKKEVPNLNNQQPIKDKVDSQQSEQPRDNLNTITNSVETESKQIPDMTLPSFDNDNTNFFSDENKSENETKSKEAAINLPSFNNENLNLFPPENKNQQKFPDVAFTSFENDSNFFSDGNEDKNTNKIETNEKQNPTLPSFDTNSDLFSSKEETKSNDVNFSFPNFANNDNTNFFSDDNKNKEEPKTKETTTLPSFDNENLNLFPTENKDQQKFPDDDNTNSFSNESKSEIETKTKEAAINLPSFDNENLNLFPTENKDQQKFPDVTFPSFDNDSNFFSDKNENDNQTNSNEKDVTLPSFDFNINDENKETSNFFSDDENKSEQIEQQNKEEENEIKNENETQKKKKPIILPKQNNQSSVLSVPNSNKSESSNIIESNQNEINFDNFDFDTKEKGENNDSFFTEKSRSIDFSSDQSISDLPQPPPIDFSNSFLSENQKKEQQIDQNTTFSTNQKINQESDLDLINAIRKQEAERAEKARLAAAAATMTGSSSTTTTNPASASEYSTPVQSSFSQAGDYEAFDETPQTSTRERKHRKHRSHRHKRKGKTEDSEGQNNEGEEVQNDESYMSFD